MFSRTQGMHISHKWLFRYRASYTLFGHRFRDIRVLVLYKLCIQIGFAMDNPLAWYARKKKANIYEIRNSEIKETLN